MASIFCEQSKSGRLNFFVSASGEEHYLFSCPYSERAESHFRGGVFLDNAIDCTRAGGDSSILRVMNRLPSHIRYIEREYGLEILRKTKAAGARHRRRAA